MAATDMLFALLYCVVRVLYTVLYSYCTVQHGCCTLYCVALYYTVLVLCYYFVILHCAVLYCTALTVQYCAVTADYRSKSDTIYRKSHLPHYTTLHYTSLHYRLTHLCYERSVQELIMYTV